MASSSGLETLANFNPITHMIDGVRALFRGDTGSVDVVIGTSTAPWPFSW